MSHLEIFFAVFAAVCGIVGTLLGAIIGDRTATKAITKQFFLQAAKDFRQVFIPQIQKLMKPMDERPSEKETALDILENSIAIHEAAMISFRNYITKRMSRAFDDAWTQYAEPDKAEFDDSPRLSYFNEGSPEKESEIRNLILHRINVLLKLTEEINT